MPRKGKTQRTLEQAGFTITRVYPGARWYEVVSREGYCGAMLCQSASCWHFFWRDEVGTGSSHDPRLAPIGGLGDAIGTDSQLATYRRLMLNPPARLLRDNPSVYRASSDVFNS